MSKAIGRIYPKKTMFLRQHVGDAKSGKTGYEMSFNIGGSHPIIRSNQTGKWWTVSWQELIELAIKKGIDVSEGGCANGD